MKFTVAVTVFTVLVSGTQALTYYQFWDEQGQKGGTVAGQISTGKCYGMPNGWNNRLRSLFLYNDNEDNEVCTFYNETGCAGLSHSYVMSSKKTASAGAVPPSFDKQYSSWICRT